MLLIAFFLASQLIGSSGITKHPSLNCSVDAFTPEFVNMESLLREYIRHHSIQTLQTESSTHLCNRKFINAVWRKDCVMIGNQVQPELNALVDAVILNRTFVASTFQCDGLFGWAPWVVTVDALVGLLSASNCSLQRSDFMRRYDYPEENRPHGPPSRCELMNGMRTDPIVSLSAANPPRMGATILGTGDGQFSGIDYYNSAYDLFNPLDERNNLTGVYKTRTETIFPNHTNARFSFHGLVLGNAFEFSPIWTESRDVYINNVFSSSRLGHLVDRPEDCSNTLTIAVHMRHQHMKSPANYAKFDQYFVDATRYIIQNTAYDSHEFCRILLASDRPHVFNLFQRFGAEVGCDIISNNFTSTKSGYKEHGPFAEVNMVLSDIYSLSHADYFVGTKISSFSMIIANYVAFNALRKNITSPSLFFVSDRGYEKEFILDFFWGIINGGRMRGTDKQVLDCREAGKEWKYVKG